MKFSGQWDGTGEPAQCKTCRPDISPSNMEAWDIYGKACMEGMGFSMFCADRMCDVFGVSDKEEVLLKMEVLHREIRKLEAEKERRSKPNPGIPGLME